MNEPEKTYESVMGRIVGNEFETFFRELLSRNEALTVEPGQTMSLPDTVAFQPAGDD